MASSAVVYGWLMGSEGCSVVSNECLCAGKTTGITVWLLFSDLCDSINSLSLENS